LTSVLAGGEWSASRPYRFTPGERAPLTHWTGGYVDPRAGLLIVISFVNYFLLLYYNYFRSRDNLVDIVTVYGLDGRVSNTLRSKICLYSTTSIRAVVSTHPPMKYVPVAISPGVKQREV
jgi:hypothetical protein